MGLTDGGLRNGGLRTLSEDVGIPDSGNLQARYDFSEEDGSLPITDQTGNGFDLTQGAYSGVGVTINGVQAGDFDGVDDVVTAATASDWRFLHNDSPFSIYIALSSDAIGDEQNNVLGTATRSSAQVGYAFRRENRDVASATNRLTANLGNGSTTFLEILEDGEFTDGNQIFSLRHDSAASPVHDAYRNGTLSGSSNNTGTYDTGDPEHPLRLGDLGGAGAYFDGAVGEILIYTTRHNDTTRGEVESYLSDKWGITV